MSDIKIFLVFMATWDLSIVSTSQGVMAGNEAKQAWNRRRTFVFGLVRDIEEKATMSRKGKLPIPLPKGVEVKVSDTEVSVKGPKGLIDSKNLFLVLR